MDEDYIQVIKQERNQCPLRKDPNVVSITSTSARKKGRVQGIGCRVTVIMRGNDLGESTQGKEQSTETERLV